MKYFAIILTILILGLFLYTMFVDDGAWRYITEELLPSFTEFLKGINIGYS